MKSRYLSLIDMVLLGESRLPSTAGALISPAASITHGLWYRFSWGCSGGSCGFQDTGATVGAAGFPAAAPVCSEVGSPNSAAGKERSPVSTYSPQANILQALQPRMIPHLRVQSVGTWQVTQSTGVYANLGHGSHPWENQTSQQMIPPSDLFCDNWSPTCQTQEVGLDDTAEMSLCLLNNTLTFHMCSTPQPKPLLQLTCYHFMEMQRENYSPV